jgi:hypothetical protein
MHQPSARVPQTVSGTLFARLASTILRTIRKFIFRTAKKGGAQCFFRSDSGGKDEANP